MKTITFKNFIKYGLENSDNIVNGMPWSFTYEGFPVTHENDNLYLITRPDGKIIKFNCNCVLYTDGKHCFVK